jgi:hypothetical protein
MPHLSEGAAVQPAQISAVKRNAICERSSLDPNFFSA